MHWAGGIKGVEAIRAASDGVCFSQMLVQFLVCLHFSEEVEGMAHKRKLALRLSRVIHVHDSVHA